jgi:hypothetical protein
MSLFANWNFHDPANDILAFLIAVVIIGCLIVVGIGIRVLLSRAEDFDDDDEPYAEDYEADNDDDELEPLVAATEVFYSSPPALLNAAARREQFAALATDCRTCGYDHIGDCLPVEAHQTAGEVTLTRHLGHAPGEHGWEWAAGMWHAPIEVLQRLEHDDWLATLLRYPHQLAHTLDLELEPALAVA